MTILILHDCFKFKCPSYKTTPDYQYVPKKLIFEVKNDLCHKERLVILGNKADPRGLFIQATIVKETSIICIFCIAHRDRMRNLCSDIGNVFIHADTKEKYLLWP